MREGGGPVGRLARDRAERVLGGAMYVGNYFGIGIAMTLEDGIDEEQLGRFRTSGVVECIAGTNEMAVVELVHVLTVEEVLQLWRCLLPISHWRK